MSEPALSLVEAQDVVATKTAPRVTLESIKQKIAKVDYLTHRTLTLAVVTMHNGYMVVGKAAPADARNYDAEVGQRYSYEDAIKQLWGLEGYALCEVLSAPASA
jgi:hypothetical protein